MKIVFQNTGLIEELHPWALSKLRKQRIVVQSLSYVRLFVTP